MANLQAERVKEQNRVKAAKLAKAVVKETPEVEDKTQYNKDHLVSLVCAILASDKQKLLDYPSVIIKAKQVLNAINEL